MAENGFTTLGTFDDSDHRWHVMRASTPAGNYIEVRSYDHDIDDDEGDPYTMTNVMALPELVAEHVASTIMANVEIPLTYACADLDIDTDTLAVLTAKRDHDILGFFIALRKISGTRKTITTVIDKLATLALSAMAEVTDDAGIDELLGK